MSRGQRFHGNRMHRSSKFPLNNIICWHRGNDAARSRGKGGNKWCNKWCTFHSPPSHALTIRYTPEHTARRPQPPLTRPCVPSLFLTPLLGSAGQVTRFYPLWNICMCFLSLTLQVTYSSSWKPSGCHDSVTLGLSLNDKSY